MKLKKTLQLYNKTIDYLQVHDVFMLKEKIEGAFTLEKNRTLTITKIYQDWSGLTVWTIDSYDKKHIITDTHFKSMIKIV